MCLAWSIHTVGVSNVGTSYCLYAINYGEEKIIPSYHFHITKLPLSKKYYSDLIFGSTVYRKNCQIN